jgi:iron(III) transport system ATP-binding protein
LADRIVVMNHGSIDQIGTPQQIYQQPTSAFVADFVGKTNPLPARRTSPGRYDWHGLELLCEIPSGSAEQSESVTLTVRPEDIVLHDASTQPAAVANRCEAQVQDLEFLGAFCRVSMRVACNGQTLVADVPTAQALRMGLRMEHPLVIDLPAPHMRVFANNPLAA